MTPYLVRVLPVRAVPCPSGSRARPSRSPATSCSTASAAAGSARSGSAEAPGGIFKAIKIIHGDLRSKDSDLVRYAEQELKALKRVKQVRHPYLLALDRYDIVDGRLMIVMELADCNLWDRFRECRDKGLPGIPRDELLLYMAETAEVLDLMNDQFQLQHLDIKPQNLFLLHNHVKVADFGQVKDLRGRDGQRDRRHHPGVRRPGDVRRRSCPGTATSTAWRACTRSCSPACGRSTAAA